MIFEDDRTEAERLTHTILVGGRDAFMSNWEGHSIGTSYAYWACTEADEDSVRLWVGERDEIKSIDLDLVLRRPAQRKTEHCKIYCVREEHACKGSFD